MFLREDQAVVTVYVDNKQVFDTWATLSGGERTANDAKTRPGGMGLEVSCGGPTVRSDIVCTTQFTDSIAAQHKALEGRIGRAPAEVQVVWLDADANALGGTGFRVKGTLKAAQEPNPSNTDSPAVGMYSITVSCSEQPA
jgi:hypothetical protein